MAEWVPVVLGIIAVPLAAIIGTIGVIGFGIWVMHKNKMARLELEEKERQAEVDRELLGLGSKDISVNLQIILDRLDKVENRLDKMEAMGNIEAARTRGAVPLQPREEEHRRQQERTGDNLA